MRKGRGNAHPGLVALVALGLGARFGTANAGAKDARIAQPTRRRTEAVAPQYDAGKSGFDYNFDPAIRYPPFDPPDPRPWQRSTA